VTFRRSGGCLVKFLWGRRLRRAKSCCTRLWNVDVKPPSQLWGLRGFVGIRLVGEGETGLASQKVQL
jgi:hypothetical protein